MPIIILSQVNPERSYRQPQHVLDERRLRVAKGDLIASLFLAVFATGFFSLLYNINPESGWPILTTIGLLSFLVMAYILQNQRKNQRKWENGPSPFPIQKVEAFWACIRSVLGIVNWPNWADGTGGRETSLKKRSANLSNIIRGPKNLIIACKITNTEAASNFGSLAIPTW